MELPTRALLDALADVDADTHSHSLEVAATAAALARKLGLTRAECAEVEIGGLLHDVGKLFLPRALLAKPGPLTRAERRLIRRHPEWGAVLVATIPGLGTVAEIVRLHHERPDGLGYPFGLACERIPIAARIVSVCDAYGAMTKPRPYRGLLTPDDALAELERHAGTQFDPDVVDALTGSVRLLAPIPA
jgi:putative nucleotidyltransferase with HDIG domain